MRIHNQFMYIYPSMMANAPKVVVSMEKATVSPITEETSKHAGYFGFRMCFPATYDREFFTPSKQSCDEWMTHIREMTEVRKVEDFFDIREKIGEGRFATVYRVCEKWGCEG